MQRVVGLAVFLFVGMGCSSRQPVGLLDCRPFGSSIPGPEDVAVDAGTSPIGPRLIVSGAERRWFRSFAKNGLYAVSIGPDGCPEVETRLPIQDRNGMACRVADPHGIAISGPIAGDGKNHLFVINHDACAPYSCSPAFECVSNQSVERYRIETDRLVFERRYTDASLLRPNDLAVSPDGEDLYVTNRSGARWFGSAICEVVLREPWSKVAHFHDDASGGTWSEIQDAMAFPNGVAISRGADQVFVAATLEEKIHVFAHDRVSGSFTPQPAIVVEGAPDNLMWNEDGSKLYAAVHPSRWRFLLHATMPFVSSPSAVVEIDPNAGTSPTTVLATQGQPVNEACATANAVSVAAPLRGRIFLGKVFDHGLVSCRFPQ